MKKIIYFSLFVFTLCIVTACSTSESAADAAKKYAEYVATGEYDKFMESIAFEDNATLQQVEERKNIMLTIFNDQVKKKVEEKGGIQQTQIASEVKSPDGTTASVMIMQTYGDGSMENTKFDMVKKDGVWKISIQSFN